MINIYIQNHDIWLENFSKSCHHTKSQKNPPLVGTLPSSQKFWSCHSFVRLLPNRDLPNPSPIFSIRSANTWHYLQRNQLHLKDRIMKSTFTKQFTTKFQLSSVIFKKWIGFCLINASSVSHIFFLVSAEFFCKGNSWLSSWGWVFI